MEPDSRPSKVGVRYRIRREQNLYLAPTLRAPAQQTPHSPRSVRYGLLVRHSACVEQGDSGGSNMSGNFAQGVSSGGQLYQSGGRLVCGQKVGLPNVSFYQPVGEALSAYGATLLTQ